MRQCAQCELHTLSFHPFIKRFKSVSFQVDVPINRTLYVWFSYLSLLFLLCRLHSASPPFHLYSVTLFPSILFLQLALSWCVTEFFFPNHCFDPLSLSFVFFRLCLSHFHFTVHCFYVRFDFYCPLHLWIKWNINGMEQCELNGIHYIRVCSKKRRKCSQQVAFCYECLCIICAYSC